MSNRNSAILRRSNSGQWHFVPTEENPADIGTRCGTTPLKLVESVWFSGPPQLMTLEVESHEEYPLIDAATDKELRPEVITRKTVVQENVEHISSERFAHFPSWSHLVGAVSWLKCCLSARVSGKGVVNSKSSEALKAAEEFVIRTVQREAFSPEIIALGDGCVVPKDSSIRSLDPYLDEKGLFREGDVILLCDKTAHRSEWPLGIVVRAYESKDSCVRKVDVRVGQDQKVFSRPTSEVVLLVPKE